jgi:hypothetical protein
MSDVYIEMTPENLAKAVSLAKAASHCTGHGPIKTAWLHALAGDSEDLSCAYLAENGETIVAAITGNGPTSEANAAFYCSARAVVLGMAKRIEELEATRMVGPFSGGRWRHG